MWKYNQTNYLCHHGVKGQKWGIRRYLKENYEKRSRRHNKTYDEKGGLNAALGATGRYVGRSLARSAAAKGLAAVTAAKFANGKVASGLAIAKIGSLSLSASQIKDTVMLGKEYMDINYRSQSSNKKPSGTKSNNSKSKTNNDWRKRYGELEDQLTYGKNADKAKNARIQKEMEELERKNR